MLNILLAMTCGCNLLLQLLPLLHMAALHSCNNPIPHAAAASCIYLLLLRRCTADANPDKHIPPPSTLPCFPAAALPGCCLVRLDLQALQLQDQQQGSRHADGKQRKRFSTLYQSAACFQA
jgi:hypothetical protein